jgi:hypothetical protein
LQKQIANCKKNCHKNKPRFRGKKCYSAEADSSEMGENEISIGKFVPVSDDSSLLVQNSGPGQALLQTNAHLAIHPPHDFS